MPDVIQRDEILEEELFLSNFRELSKRLESSEPAWLRQVREQAMDSFSKLGFPGVHQEDWKYTNLAPLSKIAFHPARAENPAPKAYPNLRDLESVLWVGSSHLVFVNGHYSQALSSSGDLPPGVKVRTLAAALEGEGDMEDHFARYADYRRHPLIALNTSSWEDGAYVRIEAGAVVEKPIHLLFVSASGGQPVVSHPRTLIVAERDTQATFIESYFGWGGGVAFSNAVTEIVAGNGSVLDHYKMQLENQQSYHMATMRVLQGRGASFASCSIALGGLLARSEVTAVLDAEGTDCTLNGLYLATGDQHVDNYTTIDHAKPHGTSHQYYKGILDDRATGVFNGRIIVRKDAQKTDAIQKNKNLLLSEGAVVDTKPQLEIFANDVRCTHGATIGQLDPEALFYLRSRGIAEKEARALLTYAFAGDILDHIQLAPFRACLEGYLHSRFSQGAAACASREGKC